MAKLNINYLKDESFSKLIRIIKGRIKTMEEPEISLLNKIALLEIVNNHVEKYIQNPEEYSQGRRNAWELKRIYHKLDRNIRDDDGVIDFCRFRERKIIESIIKENDVKIPKYLTNKKNFENSLGFPSSSQRTAGLNSVGNKDNVIYVNFF